MAHKIKRNDTPTLRWSLAADITGYTPVVIIANDDTGEQIVHRAATIVNPATGEVELALTEEETATSGSYKVEVERTLDGTRLTHPNSGYEWLYIYDDLN